MKTLDELLKTLWDDYASLNQQAYKIHELLKARKETIVNDHIAFRTFNLPQVKIDVLAQHFIPPGYKPAGEYQFPSKKLFARHYEHADPLKPKIFISELKIQECSPYLQKVVKDLIDQIPEDKTQTPEFLTAGALWKNIPCETYEKLQKESEYAAWMSVFGFRVNHFTVFVNGLKTFKTLQELNQFLKNNGFQLNSSGGEIKGTPQEYLEQSSTLAHAVEIQFADQKKVVSACYYEFARRYPMPDGKLFQGFVAQSADKIFESTDNKPR